MLVLLPIPAHLLSIRTESQKEIQKKKIKIKRKRKKKKKEKPLLIPFRGPTLRCGGQRGLRLNPNKPTVIVNLGRDQCILVCHLAPGRR